MDSSSSCTSSSSYTASSPASGPTDSTDAGAGGNKIGVLAGTAYVAGNIIGSGLFITPPIVARYAGSVCLSLIIWLVGAGVALIGALVYVELGTCIPRSGGAFTYISTAGWEATASAFFLLGSLISGPCTGAILTLTLGDYLLEGFCQWFCIAVGEWRTMAKRLTGFCVLMLLYFANMFSLRRVAARVQLAATAIKVVIVGIIIVTGVYNAVVRAGKSGR